MQGLSNRRFAALFGVNVVGGLLLFPAFGHIFYFDLHGIPKLLALTWFGVAALGLFLWPQISRVRFLLALPVSFLAVYIPATVAWAIVMRGLYFASTPTPEELWSLISSAALLGGLFTAGFWLPFTFFNAWFLRRAA